MTTLLARIESERLEARKAKDPVVASLLTTLLAEASMVGKNDGNRESTDPEVVAVVKKFLKNNKEFREKISDEEKLHVLGIEEAILTTYLPAQMSEVQIIALVEQHKFPNVGSLMKYLKENHSGEYDSKIASGVFSKV